MDTRPLLPGQYADDRNLAVRIRLHAGFSTNPTPFPRWEFGHLNLPGDARVLEVGGGPGLFWTQNADQLPPGWTITVTDLSPGMVDTARSNLREKEIPAGFAVVDTERLPFAAQSFDAVVANHMLYHVPDRLRALTDISRVLSPGGCLYTTTNGRGHLAELDEVIQRCGGRRVVDLSHARDTRQGYSLENGSEQLAQAFSDVTVSHFDDALAVDDVDAVLDFVATLWTPEDVDFDQLRDEVSARIERDGHWRIRKSLGIISGRLA